VYSILRVLLFAVPFIVFMLLGIWWWLSAITAAVTAACLSYLFLNRQRHEVSEAVYTLRTRTGTDPDNDIENDALDKRAEVSD
jgi:Protein of unknown function (DUF4229)